MTAAPPVPVSFTRFGGLTLDRPLDEVGSDDAIDLLDIDWETSTGVPRSRAGARQFTAEVPAQNYESLFVHSDFRLLARRGGATLVALKNSDGKELASTAAVSSEHLTFARMGTPTAAYTYIADTVATLKRFDGTEFASPTATVDGAAGKAMPKGRFLAMWPDGGNRLVVAGTAANGGPDGAVSSNSHVWFSEPGNAEGYESRDYVQVSPGDGEAIIGCLVWNGQVFVFKESRLFVFWGVSANEEGKARFNFRTVDLGTRLVAPPESGGELFSSGAEGVYFVSSDGLWVTTGGEPSLLSGELQPLATTRSLIGPAATTFGSLRWADVQAVKFFDDAIFVGLGATHTELLLRLDLRGFRWTVWKAALNALAVWNEKTTDAHRYLFFSASGEANRGIYFYTPAEDEDPTVEMEPRWQSGFYNLDSPDEKTLVHAKMWGTGKVDMKTAEDYGDLGSATTFNLGVDPTISQWQQQMGQMATLFSHQLSGAAPWSVQRLDRYLRETRVPETQRP